ncbi:MAG TPA: acyltransferase [Dongiaceae bacterium]|nr:acyltransferase [Dongiaceae bacterium]
MALQNGTRPGTGLRELPGLTPLRGIAALWVVFYHFSAEYLPQLNTKDFSHIIPKGYLAVDLFFLLSGFVLAHVYGAGLERGDRCRFLPFIRARLARVYPLHLFVLVVFVSLTLAVGLLHHPSGRFTAPMPLTGERSLTALVANLFMLQGIHAGGLSWNYPAWSISTEFMAYLAFPLLLPVVWRAGPRLRLALTLLLLGALAGFSYATGDYFNQWDGAPAVLRCLDEFLMGCVAYVTFGRNAAGILASDWVAFPTLGLLLLLLQSDGPDIAAVLLFAPLILATVANDGRFAQMLNARPLIWLGEISYSLYLVQDLVKYATTEFLSAAGLHHRQLSLPVSVALAAAMIVTCLLMSTLTYRLVEQPARRYLKQGLRRGGTRSAPIATGEACSG